MTGLAQYLKPNFTIVSHMIYMLTHFPV